jgi:hypothetical protein
LGLLGTLGGLFGTFGGLLGATGLPQLTSKSIDVRQNTTNKRHILTPPKASM